MILKEYHHLILNVLLKNTYYTEIPIQNLQKEMLVGILLKDTLMKLTVLEINSFQQFWELQIANSIWQPTIPYVT